MYTLRRRYPAGYYGPPHYHHTSSTPRFVAQRFRIVAVDPLGFGRSAKPLIDYKMDTWTDGFAEFMRLKSSFWHS